MPARTDTEEVTGSIPVPPTTFSHGAYLLHANEEMTSAILLTADNTCRLIVSQALLAPMQAQVAQAC